MHVQCMKFGTGRPGWSTFFNFSLCHEAPLQIVVPYKQKMSKKFHPNHCIFTGHYQLSKELLSQAL